MTNDQQIQIRKALLFLNMGSSVPLPEVTDRHLVTSYAHEYAKRRGMYLRIEETDAGLVATRIEQAAGGGSKYSEMDSLRVGETVTIQVPQEYANRVRQAAAMRNKTGLVLLRCSAVPLGVAVTSMPMGDTPGEPVPPLPAGSRSSRFDIGRLATVRELRFDLDPKDHHRLRLAVTQKTKAMGWKARVRVQDDGSMLVYRIDPGAPPAAAPAPAIDSPATP